MPVSGPTKPREARLMAAREAEIVTSMYEQFIVTIKLNWIFLGMANIPYTPYRRTTFQDFGNIENKSSSK